MCRIVLTILIALFCVGPAFNSAGQTRKIDSTEVLKALLAMPAAIPRHGTSPVVVPEERVRNQDFYSKNNKPPDDAPIEDLLAYWERWSQNAYHGPSEAVKKRLFDACLAKPELLSRFLNFLPDTDTTARKVKELYDKSLTDERLETDWQSAVKKWLLFNSTYFLDELIAMATKARENERDGDVNKEEELSALAKLSWSNAEPLLRNLIASGQPRATALALALFYQHAVDEKDTANEERYRRDLQAIASNRNQPGYARDTAIQSLSLTEWSGRDEWYLDLFQDETLLDSNDVESTMSPLHTLFNEEQEKWIPIMTRLVESKDIAVRSAAASCLILVDDEEASKKALVPLLPWLTNPTWATDHSNLRLRLIQSLSTVNIPESVPGLISIIENDDPEQVLARGFAAESVAHYQDPRVVPALKKALAKERDDTCRHRLIKGLLESHGISDMDQVAALEEFAAKLTTAEGRLDLARYRTPSEEPLSATLIIGRYLGHFRDSPTESLVAAVLVRIEELKAENPAVANALIEITHRWQGPQVELDIVRRIGSGSADAATILQAIGRKYKLQALRVELEGLSSVAGAAQGVGAVLLDSPALAQGVLNSEDEPAQIAMLACSRLTQMPLPVQLVGPFLRHRNPLLAEAAETYLLAEDSAEARELLWQHHPNEAFITGWRDQVTYSSDSNAYLQQREEKLRGELLKDNGPVEILAFLSTLTEEAQILRIYSDKAIYSEHEDAARYRERTVRKAEVSVLKDFLATGGFADRGPTLQWCHHTCVSTELLILTKAKGRRVFSQGGSPSWNELKEQFSQLARGDGTKVHYKLEEEIKGLEVLYAGELTVNDVAQQGGELRVFVERAETPAESEERVASYDYNDDDDEALYLERSRRRLEIDRARFSWRVFADDKPAAVTTQPESYRTTDFSRFMVHDESQTDWEDALDHETQVINGDSIIVAREFDGLWRQFAGAKPVRLGAENASYSNAIVTRDGKWVVLSKTESEDNKERQIVRLNLQTGREFRVNVPVSDQFTPVAALASAAKVVLRRAKDDYEVPGRISKGPTRPEHYLLDAATGVTQLISGGDFTPLLQSGTRFLQRAEKPDEFWAAVPDDSKNQTQIGLYSVKDFSFKPVMIVPQIKFNSMSMWVDAGAQKVYLAYKGQLLRLPLQVSVTKK